VDKYFSRGLREIDSTDGTAAHSFLSALGTTSTLPPAILANDLSPNAVGEAWLCKSGLVTAAECRSIGQEAATQRIVLATGIDAAHGLNIRGQLVVFKPLSMFFSG
jgi:hypothetical protein